MGWILENLFLIFIIVSGIIAVLGDNKKKDQGEQQKRQTPPPSPRQSNSAPRTTQRQPRAERQVYTEEKRPDISAGSGSIQEQQQEQMERLANKFRSQVQNLENVEQKDISSLLTTRKQESQGISQEDLKRRVSNNFNAEGLVNGIIMSEVLGSPRAKKPYRSVVRDRTR